RCPQHRQAVTQKISHPLFIIRVIRLIRGLLHLDFLSPLADDVFRDVSMFPGEILTTDYSDDTDELGRSRLNVDVPLVHQESSRKWQTLPDMYSARFGSGQVTDRAPYPARRMTTGLPIFKRRWREASPRLMAISRWPDELIKTRGAPAFASS